MNFIEWLILSISIRLCKTAIHLQECTLLEPVGPFVGWSSTALQEYLQGPNVVQRRKEVSHLIATKSFGHTFDQGKWFTRQRPVFVRVWFTTLK